MRLNLNKRPRLARRTRERELILDRVQTLPGHFDAEELWSSLARQGARVSRATVYRTLELLVTQNILQRVQLDEGGAKYEPMRGRPAHAHLFCLGCGRLADYNLPLLGRLPAKVRRNCGFRTAHMLLRICGYCGNCEEPRAAKSPARKAGRRSASRTRM